MIRYPGSKDKIVRAIMARFPEPLLAGGLFNPAHLDYREPFFGAGAVGFRVLQSLDPQHIAWINDRDYGITCLWKSVQDVPGELCQRVRDFVPSVEAFYRFRDEDVRRDLDYLETGFRKLALHQTSFSGLGAKAGGPIGGRQQSSTYNVDCRWNPSRICRDIWTRHKDLTSVPCRISTGDFAPLITNAPSHAFIYADPPYIEKGAELYKHSMSEADHRRLAALLRQCRGSWVVSYDDHPLVRELYAWADIRTVDLTYTTAVANGSRRKNSEVIISRATNITARKAAQR